MFIKVYKYKIRKHDFKSWKKINDAARTLYKKYGSGNSKRLIRKYGEFIYVVELDSYKSKKDFGRILKQVNKDKKITALYHEFLNIIYQKRIYEEEFKTI